MAWGIGLPVLRRKRVTPTVTGYPQAAYMADVYTRGVAHIHIDSACDLMARGDVHVHTSPTWRSERPVGDRAQQRTALSNM